MTWSLAWHEVAVRDLRAMHWRAAAAIDAAVMRFAATGRGEVARLSPTDPRRLRLRASGVEALLFADLDERRLHVVRVFRRL